MLRQFFDWTRRNAAWLATKSAEEAVANQETAVIEIERIGDVRGWFRRGFHTGKMSAKSGRWQAAFPSFPS